MPSVGIVCDSTCDLEPAWLEAHDVRMVPLTVFFGDEAYKDWIELRPEEFYRKLGLASELPHTSQPSPADFAKAYSELAASGCSEIVSIHLSEKVSGTIESANLAASKSEIPIRVVDSKAVTQATSLAIKAALAVRDAGGSADDVERAALETARSTKLLFILETLEYLVKGGRAGKATGLAASVLNIKPILTFNDEGEIAPFKKVRGQKQAIQELAQYVAEDTRARGPMTVALLHAHAPDLAERLHAALVDAGADVEIESTGLVGAVVGTYTGQHAVGLAYHPAR